MLERIGIYGIHCHASRYILRNIRIILVLLLFLIGKRFCKGFLDCRPSFRHNSFAFDGKLRTLALCRNRAFQIFHRFGCGAKHTLCDQYIDFLFAFSKRGYIRCQTCFCGNDSMVIGHFGIVNHLLRMKVTHHTIYKRQPFVECKHNGMCHIFHIFGQILAVGSGIGNELCFVELLGIIKGLLCREPIVAVRFSLQGSQIVELRRLCAFFHAVCYRDFGILAVAVFCKCFRTFLVKLFLSGQFQAVLFDMDFVISFLCEILNLSFSLGEHGKGRCLHSSDSQLLSVLNRKQSGGIDTHKPVCFGTALCRTVKAVIIAPGAKILKTVTNGTILHRTDPQTEHGFSALGKLVGHTEDRLSLTSCIASVDNTFNILSVHELFENGKLLFGIGRYHRFPIIGQNGKIGVTPFCVLFVIVLRLRKLHQMPYTPTDDISAALIVAVLTFICAENLADGKGNTRFFRYYKNHLCTS